MRIRRLLFMLAIASVFGSGGSAGQPVDISGTWSFSVDMGSAQGMPTFVFKQQGERLTGTVNSGRGAQPVSGTVKGEKAVFGFQVRERSFKATYRGTIESPTKMTGTVEYTGALSGTGSWSATKK